MNIKEIKKMAADSLDTNWEDTIEKFKCSHSLKTIIKVMYILGYTDGSKYVCKKLNEEVEYERII